MPQSTFGEVLRFLYRACGAQGDCGLTDGELLERFSANREESAFALLVQRYGPMVFGVCKRMLGDLHEAEDVFQATFLVLVRRAGSIRRKDSVGSWLYGVAQRIALKARAQTAARRHRERGAENMARSRAVADRTCQELPAALDEAIGVLPEKYRAPIVLCYLEGKSYDQAARQLGCPKSSLASRLAQAELLRRHLEKQGITLAVGALTTALAEAAVAAPVPAALTIKTVKAAGLLAAGKVAAVGCLSARAIALAEEAVAGMMGIKGALGFMVLGLGLAIGAAGLAAHAWQEKPAQLEKSPASPIKDDTSAIAKKDPSGAAKTFDDPLPAGSLRRFGTSRYRHGTPIASLAAVSADGRVAAAASGGHIHGSVRVFDLDTGQARALMGNPPHTLTDAVALSPDGRMLATKERYVVHLRDAFTGKELRSIDPDKANGGTITSWLQFTPDGKSVAVATAEGRGIHLLDVDKGVVVRTFPHQHVVFAAAFTADAKLLAGGGYDSENGNYLVRLWEVATGKELRHFLNGPRGNRALAFSPDGKTLAGGGDDAQLRLWDVETGKELRKFAPDGYRIRSVAFAPEGQTVASAGDSIRLYDPATGKERLRINRKAGGLAFSTDGRILTGAVMGAIYRWDPATGRQLTPMGAGDSAVDQIMASPDGRRLFTRGQDGDAHIWDAQTGAHQRYLNANWQRGLALSPDGRFLVWPVEEDKVQFKDPAHPNSTHTGSRLRLYDIGADQFIDRFPGFEGDAHDMSFAPDGKTLVTVDHRDARLRLWDVASGKELLSFCAARDDEKARQHFVWRTVLSPDGKTLAATYQSASSGFIGSYSVRLWDMATGRELHDLPGHLGYVHGMAFSPDSRFFVTGSEPLTDFVQSQTNRLANQVYVWDVATGRRVPALPNGLPTGATSVAYAPDGWTIATAAADGTIRLWEAASYTVRAEFRGHRDRVTSLAFTPDGRLLSGSVDTTVLAWDVRPPLRDGNGPLAAAWESLLQKDASLAFKAMGRLRASPKEAVAFLADRLKPAEPVDPKRLAELITELDSQQFTVRQKAIQGLEKLGETAEEAVRKGLQAKPSLEARLRLEAVLEKRRIDPEVPRRLRAVETLELIGTPEAQQLLKLLVDRTPNPVIVDASAGALYRLTRRQP